MVSLTAYPVGAGWAVILFSCDEIRRFGIADVFRCQRPTNFVGGSQTTIFVDWFSGPVSRFVAVVMVLYPDGLKAALWAVCGPGRGVIY